LVAVPVHIANSRAPVTEHGRMIERRTCVGEGTVTVIEENLTAGINGGVNIEIAIVIEITELDVVAAGGATSEVESLPCRGQTTRTIAKEHSLHAVHSVDAASVCVSVAR